MNVEVSASVCCSCDAVRMTVEKDVSMATSGAEDRARTRWIRSMVRLT